MKFLAEHFNVSDMDKEQTRETVNSWVTKGGAGIIASAVFMFGTNFLDKQEEILQQLSLIQRTIVSNEADRARLQYQIDGLRTEVKQLEKLTNQQWARVRRSDEVMKMLTRELQNITKTEIEIPELDRF